MMISAVTDTKGYDGTCTSSQMPIVQVDSLTPGTLYDSDTIDVRQAFTSKDVLGADGSTLAVGYAIHDGVGGPITRSPPTPRPARSRRR